MSVTPLAVAIMQPYFLPYLGYFRLFAASDLFVIYDCVQFPRRGWVHRNRFVDVAGVERWLTLPLEKAPQNVLIRDLRFAPNAGELLAARLRRFPLDAKDPRAIGNLLAALRAVEGRPLDYIERLLECAVGYVGIPWNVIRSSSLDIPAQIGGQARILEIARRLGAGCYVNASGGRDLYDRRVFAGARIELRFLPDYVGPRASILTRMLHEDRNDLGRDIRATTGAVKPR